MYTCILYINGYCGTFTVYGVVKATSRNSKVCIRHTIDLPSLYCWVDFINLIDANGRKESACVHEEVITFMGCTSF